MRRERGQGGREPRTNNEKKSPTNIFFPLSFLIPGSTSFLGENLNGPLTHRERGPGGWGTAQKGRGPTLCKCLFLTNGPHRTSARPPGRPPPLSASRLLGNVCLRLVAPLDSRLFSGLPGSESADDTSHSSRSHTLKFLPVGHTGDPPRVNSREGFMTFSVK